MPRAIRQTGCRWDSLLEMSKASFTVTIERPPAEVLAYVADLRHMPDWSPGADSVELISGHEPGEVGARFLVTAKHMIEDDVVMDCETTAIELEQLVAFAVRHPTLTGTDTYHLGCNTRESIYSGPCSDHYTLRPPC